MIVKNTKSAQSIKRVTATMAIEEMYFDKAFIKEAIKVANGEKTSEELRKEVLKKYAR